MKKIYKKASLIIVGFGIVLSIASTSVTAAGIVGTLHRTSSGHGFSKPWQEATTSGKAKLIYGYNTFLINEDYAWAYHTTNSHKAMLGNANGAHSSSKKAPGSKAAIEVRHKGTSIKYQNTWY